MSAKVPSVRPRDTRRSGPKYAGSTMQAPRKWSPEEDELLKRAVAEIGAKQWKAVADRVPGRNHVQCLQRYLRVLQPGLKKGHWTPEEDEKLRQLASNGFTSWIEAAEQIPGRSAKQCRDRWRNHLEGSIKHTPWEPEEDALLLELHAKHGNRWAAIARCLPGRTENAVKIHCKSLLTRKAALPEGSSTSVGFDNPFETAGSESQASKLMNKDASSAHGYRELDEEAEETSDDLSSTSPLPSPVGFAAPWMLPWQSPTNTAPPCRSMGNAPYPTGIHGQGLHSSLPQGHGVLRTTRLQSFPPPMLSTNLPVRRGSFVSSQAATQQPHQGSSIATGVAKNATSKVGLFAPIDTSTSLLFDPMLLEHVPSPINSPTNASYASSPNQHGFLNAFHAPNLRVDLSQGFRAAGANLDVSGERFFVSDQSF